MCCCVVYGSVFFLFFFFFFFFKQKTAYEIMPSLVGSEMCIRDSICTANWLTTPPPKQKPTAPSLPVLSGRCLLYTSDAADDLLCVDLGGRRIIKKKKNKRKKKENKTKKREKKNQKKKKTQ